ncbi:hypothetical protein DAMDJJ_16340 [Cupriavidus necator]
MRVEPVFASNDEELRLFHGSLEPLEDEECSRADNVHILLLQVLRKTAHVNPPRRLTLSERFYGFSL